MSARVWEWPNSHAELALSHFIAIWWSSAPHHDTELCSLCDTICANRLHYISIDCTLNGIERNALFNNVDNNSHCVRVLFETTPSVFDDVILCANMDTHTETKLFRIRIKIRFKLKILLLWTFFETYYNYLTIDCWYLIKYVLQTRLLGFKAIFIKENVNFIVQTAMKI